MARRSSLRRPRSSRLLGWLYTGPLGHLYSVVVDVMVFSTRAVLAAARRRLGR